MSDEYLADDSPTTRMTELKSRQRRVLGVLVEKAFTTPEYYPMTLKALTAGCNQKSNREPVVQYTEDEVEETLEQLRQMGLAAVVHTESGRTERFRHYLRKRLTLSEPQIAILTELLLRGRQQLGELRSRASRMVPVDSLDVLRAEMRGLIDLGLAQAGGELERRGVEVDHNLYADRERERNQLAAPPPSMAADDQPQRQTALSSEPFEDPVLQRLRDENQELRQQIADLQENLVDLQRDVSDLRRDLGA